jgi:predicted TIM-barrel fold metal-dependent hydrolase
VHSSSPVPILQLYAAGVFDRHPNLRLITSRSGLTIASLLPRIESLSTSLPPALRPRRSFLDVWQHNFYVTTEDVLDMASMKALLEQIPMDRVMYGANYPFEERGKALMAELKESGVVGREEWQGIASGNAEALFGLRGAVQRGKSSY